LNYELRRQVIARVPIIPISQSEFIAIESAREVLKRIRACEDSFDLVMENYTDLEGTVLSESLQHLVFDELNYISMNARLNLFGRKVLNFLSSARHYLDTLPQHAKRVVEDNAVDEIRHQTRNAYDSSLAYRAMEALRNYSQHYAIPVQYIEFNASKEDGDDKYHFSYRVTPFLRPDTLKEGGAFKSSVLSELVPLGTKIELLPLIREYVENLGAIHSNFRKISKSKYAESSQLFETWIEMYEKQDPDGKSIGLAAVQKEGTQTIKTVYIVRETIDYIKYVRRKNRSAVNFSRRFVKW